MKKTKLILLILLIVSSCSKNELEPQSSSQEKQKQIHSNKTSIVNEYNPENYLALLSQLTVKAIVNDIEARKTLNFTASSVGVNDMFVSVYNLINLNDGLNKLELAIINEYDGYVNLYPTLKGVRPKSIPPPDPDDDDGEEGHNGQEYMKAINFLNMVSNMCLEYHIPNPQAIVSTGSLLGYMQSNNNLIATNHPLNLDLYNDALLFTGNPYLDADIVVNQYYQSFNALIFSVRPEANNSCFTNSNVDYTLFLN